MPKEIVWQRRLLYTAKKKREHFEKNLSFSQKKSQNEQFFSQIGE